MSKKYISICAVTRNEGLYIREWLDYHIKQGVERFYIYDNESTDDTYEILNEYDCVQRYRTLGYKQQGVAYNNFIDLHKNETEWCAFLDIDEFLIATNHQKFVDGLREYDQPNISGVAIHWYLFGSNGHTEYSSEPVLKRFTKRSASVNSHVKSVMRMSYTFSMGLDPHSFRAAGDIVDENYTVMPLNYAITPGTADILRINHYVTKSQEEHRIRRTMPDANSGHYRNIEEHFKAHDCNDVEDTLIWSRL